MDKIEIVKGDITKIEVDAIVNAANSSLMGSGGVDGAIHKAGGNEILKECKAIVEKQGKCDTGEAVITTAGKLPAKHVIHTVGPVWNGEENKAAEKLESCYLNSLKLAKEHNCKTIAFPSISTGAYRFPKEKAAKIALASIRNFLNNHEHQFEKILLVSFDDENHDELKKALDQ